MSSLVHPSNPGHYRLLSPVLLLLALGLYVYFQVLPLLGDRGTGIVGLAAHSNDYKHVYLGSRLLFDGLSPYDRSVLSSVAYDYSQTVDPRFRSILPYVYLPFTGLVMRPFSLLPFAQSVVAFQLFNHVLLLGGLVLLWWIGRRAGARWMPLWFLVAWVVWNAAVARQNAAGQLNVVLFFGMALLAWGVERGKRAAGHALATAPALGFLAAFLMLFKLSPGIFLFWFLLRREWSLAAWMVGWALVLTALTVVLFGLPVHLEFLPLLRDMGYGRSTWGDLPTQPQTFWRDPYNQSFNALFHRLLVEKEGSGITPWLNLPHGAANAATWLTSLVILGSLGAVVWRTARRTDALLTGFSAAVCASLLLPSIMWDHYLVQALVPAALLWAEASRRDRRLSLVLIVLAVLIICLPVAFDSDIFRQGPLLILMSLKLVPPLMLFIIALHFAHSSTLHQTGEGETQSS